MQANPLYLNEHYAQSIGFERMLVSPLMVLNIAFGLSVQNDSEQAIAHLGYYDVVFTRPVYIGETLQSETKVLYRRWRGVDKPGIVRVRTLARNQNDEIVISYERAILVPPSETVLEELSESGSPTSRKTDETLVIELPFGGPKSLRSLTGNNTYYEDYRLGQIILHRNGRTVTDEHIPWTYRLGNTHPLHYDRQYSSTRTGPMSGEPTVFGGIVFAWLEGLASRDISENALCDIGYTEGYHTNPVKTGDTLYALSRVLAKKDCQSDLGIGTITTQLVGIKNMTGEHALRQYGQEIFQRESNKQRNNRIPVKIFEIERRLLVKKRAAWI